MYKPSIKIIILIIFLCILFFFLIERKISNNKIENFLNITNKDIIEIDNVYDENLKLKWVDYNNSYLKKNYPDNINHDFEIKKDLVDKALKLEKNTCVIDCGAHIGDGAIPIAQVLKNKNRNDVIVYAIDPSKDKCEFIKYLAKINNLKNLKVLQYGLSDNTKLHYQNLPKDNNSGGSVWLLDKVNKAANASNYTVTDSLHFITLDELIKKRIIKEKLGVIHLDVEGMEVKVVKGGIKTINKDKPYLSLEDNDNNRKDQILELLNDYNFVERISSNNIFKNDL